MRPWIDPFQGVPDPIQQDMHGCGKYVRTHAGPEGPQKGIYMIPRDAGTLTH